MPSDLDNLIAIKSGYLTQLAADAAGDPTIDYSIDGESVQPSTWRDSIWGKIKEIDAQIAARQPFIIMTHQRM